MRSVETLIVGGGQAGLSLSYYLTRQGRDHLVCEQASRPGHAWRSDRWDSFTLVTPNWSFQLPGAEYNGPDPDGFMPRDEVVQRFERYVGQYSLPVEFGLRVLSVEAAPGQGTSGYRVVTDQDEYRARNVAIATGLFQKPKIPPFGAGLPADILQIPSGQYRNPEQLPPGAVLVVGSGQSGCQIAEELYQSGRKVYLSTGSAGRAPRCYRGRDVFDWLNRSGFLNRTLAQLPSPQARFDANPQLTGKNGGHTLNLHQFYRDGVALLGRTQAVQDRRIFFALDRNENLAKADQVEAMICEHIDGFIRTQGLNAPEEQLPSLQDGFAAPDIISLDLRAADIRSVIWALGYSFDFGLVKLPVFDDFAFPQTERGVTGYPGLYFLGLPWLPGQITGLLFGVGEQAAYVAEHIDKQ